MHYLTRLDVALEKKSVMKDIIGLVDKMVVQTVD